MTDPPRRQTRWRLPRVRVSVRALMGVVLVLAIGLGAYVRSVHIQQDAVAAIRRVGGSFDYDWEWGNYNPDIITYNGKWRAPKWLAKLVPVDYAANVEYVSLIPQRARGSIKADDETLAWVGRLRHLKALFLTQTAITDAGLAQLRGLTDLRDLRIDQTQVSDSGLEHLKGMAGLRTLWISGTRITDDGLLDLERASPGLLIYRFEERATSQYIPRAMDDLDYARSQPVRLASALLVHRARAMTSRRDDAALIATVEALCDLEAVDKLSLVKLAEDRGECLAFLAPSFAPTLSASQRQRLQRLCADRGIAALKRAIELGYDNLRRLDGDLGEVRMLVNLRDHPDFPKLVAAMKARRPGR